MNEKIEQILEVMNSIKYFDSIKLEDKQRMADRIVKLYWNKFDVIKELFKMEVWLDLNPRRRKKDYRRFIWNWLNRVATNIEVKKKMKEFERRYYDKIKVYTPRKKQQL